MKTLKTLLLLVIAISINGCKTRDKRIFKKHYYPSGKLQSSGWFLNDTVRIDTSLEFYENGTLLAMDIFDSLGRNIKSVGYYENGRTSEVINYENGLAQGFRYHYYANGLLKKKVFYFSDITVGDAYFFDSSNLSTSYNFNDWAKHTINLLKYDTNGNVLKDIKQKTFIDSLRLFYDSVKNKAGYELLLIISNPPFCSTNIKIDYVSVNSVLLKSATVVNLPKYFKKELLPDSLSYLNIQSSQYDSIQNRTLYQKSRMNLSYQ